MTKEVTIEKMIHSMKTESLIPLEEEARVREYLDWMYQAGWDARGSELVKHNKKPVIQYDMEGHVLGKYGSVVEASKATGFSTDSIYGSIWHDRPTKRRHVWKYA